MEIIKYIFRKIITLNEVNILESPNKSRKKLEKSPFSCFVHSRLVPGQIIFFRTGSYTFQKRLTLLRPYSDPTPIPNHPTSERLHVFSPLFYIRVALSTRWIHKEFWVLSLIHLFRDSHISYIYTLAIVLALWTVGWRLSYPLSR